VEGVELKVKVDQEVLQEVMVLVEEEQQEVVVILL